MPCLTPFDSFQKASKKTAFAIAGLLTRLCMGILFFYAGWVKLVDPEGWSAAGYLSGSTGFFAEWFQSLAGSGFVDFLVIWGFLLIGVALILGVFVRPASFFGAVMMLLFYFANFVSNAEYGLINEHIVTLFIFSLFFFGGFGHLWGLDSLIERQLERKTGKWIFWLFG